MEEVDNRRKPKPPAKNHPWKRNTGKTEVLQWAREQSRITGVNNWKVGGGKPQK